jgi:oligopeptide transport system substrate-binding protein
LEEGRKYIFHLRDDVRWSDGRPVTAADFEYAWKRVLHPATASEEANLLYDLKGARAFHQGQGPQPERVGVWALDPLTLVVELERPAGYFLQLLTYYLTFPVPQHVVKTYGPAWTAPAHIVCNGPFKVTAWQPGDSMTLARNPAYHGSFQGNVDRGEVRFGLAQAVAWSMYEAGQLDLAPLFLLSETWQQHTPDFRFSPFLNTFYLDFDLSRPPFHDLRARQALILALDRQRWADSPLSFQGLPALGGFIPPGMPGHAANLGLPFDPAQARRLLAEAGYLTGQHFPMVDWLVAEGLEPLADDIQAQWQQHLGIQVSRKTTLWGMLYERVEQDQPALVLRGWVADYPDPDSFLRVCLQQQLGRGWRNEAYDRLIEQARNSTDQRERIELYRQADRILVEEAPLMPAIYGRWGDMVKPWVKGYARLPNGTLFWKDLVIEPH